jgi:alpha-mannosidase
MLTNQGLPTAASTETINRRTFLVAAAIAAAGFALEAEGQDGAANPPDAVLVSNFHPASCGWLTTFSRERVYCANSYLDHLDRVRDDPNYAFVLSEVNNIIAIMNFKPERIPELKQRIAEKRVELVNGFFLESTVNLSGGEALVRLGVEGRRWYQQVFGMTPRYAWTIDVCGTHDQMAQIAAGLGLEAMVYTRANPTGKTLHWSVSPDGSRILSVCPGHYSEENEIFKTTTPLTDADLDKLEASIAKREQKTPAGAPILILAGSGDYTIAPVLKSYPSELLRQWKAHGEKRQIRFATFSSYMDQVRPGIDSGKIEIPTMRGGTAYEFNAFWIENNEVKTRYRASEQSLQAAELLATAASMTGTYAYPTQKLHEAWILMCLNMDRNTLWGSAGGMVFVSDQSWDVQDRFQWVDAAVQNATETAGRAVLPAGNGFGLFNPLNWKRSDPVELKLPTGKRLQGVTAELLPNGAVLCQPAMPSSSVAGWKLTNDPPRPAETTPLPEAIETAHYTVRIDPHTGALVSLKMHKSGRELLGGPANVIVAERPKKKEAAPADFMAAHPDREMLATSSDSASSIECKKGPVAYTITATGTLQGNPIRRTMRFYHEHPRIDFVTELNDVHDYTVIVAHFPLAAPVLEVRRGIPYGFSHGAVAVPNPELHGWTKGIVPAVRWIDHAMTDEAGLAIFDRGLSGRELDGQLAMVYLLNAEDSYHGYPNPWLTGSGRHECAYSILPREQAWPVARIPQSAWEFNQSLIPLTASSVSGPRSFLETSDNVIVEAVRREQGHIEVRMVEAFGMAGEANVRLLLPHRAAAQVDFTGKKLADLPVAPSYKVSLAPQQIVTLHFEVSSDVGAPELITAWDRFVPQNKLAALRRYEPGLKGHPPTGDGVAF